MRTTRGWSPGRRLANRRWSPAICRRRSAPPCDGNAFVAFGTWLTPKSAAQLEQSIARLRESGEPFSQVVATKAGRLIEVRGRTVGGSAVARFRDLTGDRLALAKIQASRDLLAAEVETMRAMLAAAPMPIWLRDTSGALVWVNAAYAVGGRGQRRRRSRGARARTSRTRRRGR